MQEARPQVMTAERSSEAQTARWVLGVLAILIDVVGPRSVLGVILRQAFAEIASVHARDHSVGRRSTAA